MKAWRYSLYTFNDDLTHILTYSLVVLILHSQFTSSILFRRPLFFWRNFSYTEYFFKTKFHPIFSHTFFFAQKTVTIFLKTFNWTFVAFFSRGHGISLLHFQGRKLIFFFMEEFISILNGFLNWTQITLIMHEDFDMILLIL